MHVITLRIDRLVPLLPRRHGVTQRRRSVVLESMGFYGGLKVSFFARLGTPLFVASRFRSFASVQKWKHSHN